MVEDDLEPFLTEFGEPAILKGRQVTVIFDNDYAPAFDDFAEGRNIVACLKTEDLGDTAHFDKISIRGKLYTVNGVHPAQDGRFTDLILTE